MALVKATRGSHSSCGDLDPARDPICTETLGYTVTAWSSFKSTYHPKYQCSRRARWHTPRTHLHTPSGFLHGMRLPCHRA